MKNVREKIKQGAKFLDKTFIQPSRDYNKKQKEKDNQLRFKAIHPNIETTSKKTPTGEIINPTKEDVKKYDSKYETVRMKRGRSSSDGMMMR